MAFYILYLVPYLISIENWIFLHNSGFVPNFPELTDSRQIFWNSSTIWDIPEVLESIFVSEACEGYQARPINVNDSITFLN